MVALAETSARGLTLAGLVVGRLMAGLAAGRDRSLR
eukprot:SAG31_NODE_30056_length_386_cov_0.609756_1_plen_35_part_10